jgi:hypothetical protein
MVDEDYEIISHKEVARLKQELKSLKEGELTASTNEISHKLNQMIDIFKEASIMMKDEKSSKESHNELSDKLDKLLDQNQKIAEGVLAVADMINQAKSPQPVQITPEPQPMRPEPIHPDPLNIPGSQPMQPMSPEPIHPGPLNVPGSQPLPTAPLPSAPLPVAPRPIRRGVPPAPEQDNFPHPGMPSLNPMEEQGKTSMGGLDIPPLPQKPHKKGLFH